MISNWSHLNVRRHSFDFNLSNIAVAVQLFGIVVAVVVVAALIIPVIRRQ